MSDLITTEVVVDKYSVDDLLDRVDYSFPGYVPSKDAFNFMNFMRLVFGEEPENKNSMAHYFLIDVIFRHVNPWEYYEIQSDIARENYIAVMCHREFSKSVLLGSILALYMAYYGEMPNFGPVYFGGYIGNSVRGGVRQNMQTIAGVYKDSDFLQDKFEFTHFTDSAIKFIRHPRKNANGTIKKADSKIGRRTFVMEGYGAQAGPRGSRDGLVRPQFFIIDDVIKNAADSRSDIILGNIRSMIEEDIGYALHGGNSFCIYIGTPFNLRDPLMNALIDGTWTPVVFPIAERVSLDITKEEFKGSWEDRHSYEKVMIKYRTAAHKGTLPAFMQEQMLRVASEEDRLVPDRMIKWVSRKDIIPNGGAYTWYITTDFTTTGARGSDFSGIFVWAMNENQDKILVDMTLKKMELKEQYEEVFKMVRKYKKMRGHIEVGVETDGQQRTHIFVLREMMIKLNVSFTIAHQKGRNEEGILRKEVKGNKFDYFKLMVPDFQNIKIQFAEELEHTPDMIELLSQIAYVSYLGIGSKNDDGLDCVSQLSQLNIVYPQGDDGMKELVYNPKLDMWEEDEDSEVDSSTSGCIF